jgi:hypothetical protein
MTRNDSRQGAAARLAGIARLLARRIHAVIAECNYAQRRMTILNTAPDRVLMDPHRMPDTYAEFMFRTSGVLLHELSARQRAKGRHPVQ